MRILIILFLTISQFINAQENESLKLISSGKWYIDYFEVAGQKMESSEADKDFNWFLYTEGGSYEAIEDKQDSFGKWEYIPERKVIIIDDINGKHEQKVISVTKEKLIISIDDDGMDLIIAMKKY